MIPLIICWVDVAHTELTLSLHPFPSGSAYWYSYRAWLITTRQHPSPTWSFIFLSIHYIVIPQGNNFDSLATLVDISRKYMSHEADLPERASSHGPLVMDAQRSFHRLKLSILEDDLASLVDRLDSGLCPVPKTVGSNDRQKTAKDGKGRLGAEPYQGISEARNVRDSPADNLKGIPIMGSS